MDHDISKLIGNKTVMELVHEAKTCFGMDRH